MRHEIDYIKKNKVLILLILPAFFLYMLLIFPSGTFLCFKSICGLNFWGVHGHDAIWHLAIAMVSFKTYPFIAPTFSGANLYGYNYLLDLIIYLISKVGIAPVLTYFKILPVVWFILFTGLLIRLGRKINDSILFIFLFLLFNYFGGSFSYIITLIHHQTINGSSTVLPQPAMHMMSNLPYAYSLLFFIYLLILMIDGKIDTKFSIIAGINIFLIMGLKFYGGVVSIFMILSYIFFKTIRINFRSYVVNSFVVSTFVIIGIFLFYNPFTSLKTGSIFGFAPFALVHTITEDPGNFYLRSLTDARYYLVENGIGPRFIAIESLNLFLFLLFYLGTRFFGLIYIFYLIVKKKLTLFDATVILTAIFATTLTVLLVQKAEWWNTIQFFFYAIFLMTIFITKLTYDIANKKKLFSWIIVAVIIILSVPTSYDLVRLFSQTPGATYLSKNEMAALDFLRYQPDGVVLSPLYDSRWKKIDVPNPLYTYEDTAYVSAFSGKQSYYANLLQLRITGVPYQSRLKRLISKDCSVVNEVDYIYEIRNLLDNEKIMIYCKPKNFKQIYKNDDIQIYSKIK